VKDEDGLVFMGFLILMDPPKKDALPALERFRKLGVDIYVLTGDGPLVTEQVCRQVGVMNKSGLVLQGTDMAGMDEAELRKTVETHNIYARLTPNDKLAIVKALRANGHIVGFIGDGVNDAPSLKAADVGISVNNGADIAKDASDVVLLHKSLNVVANGISEGRSTFGNIIKYIHSTISANFGNMFTLTIASLFLPFIPLLPSQILLNNLISDVPMLTVSTDNVDRDELRKPKRWNIGQITRFMVFFGLISSVFDLVTMAFVFFMLSADMALFRTVWFLESVLSEIFVVFAVRTFKPFYLSMPSMLLISTSVLATLAAVGIIYSPLASFFQFAPLSAGVLGIVLGIVVVYVLVVEAAKHAFFWIENRREEKQKARAQV
jgi:Mg2+-importing ATPase